MVHADQGEAWCASDPPMVEVRYDGRVGGRQAVMLVCVPSADSHLAIPHTLIKIAKDLHLLILNIVAADHFVMVREGWAGFDLLRPIAEKK